MAVTLRVKNLDTLAGAFKMGTGARPTVRMALNITGPAAAYALVWEFGKVSIKPGPKAMYSTNAMGESVVLTKTAPYGFIRIHRPEFRQYIREELAKVQWKRIAVKQIPGVVDWALTKAAYRCRDLIAETAPYDTGALRSAIEAVYITTGDQIQGSVTDKISLRLRVKP